MTQKKSINIFWLFYKLFLNLLLLIYFFEKKLTEMAEQKPPEEPSFVQGAFDEESDDDFFDLLVEQDERPPYTSGTDVVVNGINSLNALDLPRLVPYNGTRLNEDGSSSVEFVCNDYELGLEVTVSPDGNFTTSLVLEANPTSGYGYETDDATRTFGTVEEVFNEVNRVRTLFEEENPVVNPEEMDEEG